MRTLEFREKAYGTVVVVDGVEYYNREQLVAIVTGSFKSSDIEMSGNVSKKSKNYINPTARKLSDADVRHIRANLEGWTKKQWADHFKVSGPTISHIVNGKSYKDVV